MRHILRDAQAKGIRVAVVSNEFGELGIDRALLGEGGEAFVELEGGCVCCQLSDELVETLERLRTEINPDRIVIETSGVALPADVQLDLWREPVSNWVESDIAVVVVNAEQVIENRDLEGTFEDQVSSADLLVMNQVDRVAGVDLERIDRVLRKMEPEAPILRTVNGDLDVNVLFPPDAVRRPRGASAREHQHASYLTRELEIEDGIEENVLVGRLQALDSLRSKGFVRTTMGTRLVQGVGRRVELSDFDPPADIPLGRVVVIERA